MICLIAKELFRFKATVTVVMISRYNAFERSLFCELTKLVVLERLHTTIRQRSCQLVAVDVVSKSCNIAVRVFDCKLIPLHVVSIFIDWRNAIGGARAPSSLLSTVLGGLAERGFQA